MGGDERDHTDVTGRTMNPYVSGITLGVSDLNRAKRFYAKGLGWPVQMEQGDWVSFGINDGGAVLGLYPWDSLAGDAGVAPEGSGFRGVTFSYLVRSDERVAEVLAEAERAGGTITKPAEVAAWGGASGIFADPDGYLWKVASGAGAQPFAE
jgi:catechol 2,3-dioxygenase-like lactoylglutathione lyase family enzyme